MMLPYIVKRLARSEPLTKRMHKQCLVLRNIDSLRVVGDLAAGDFGKRHGKRLFAVRLGNLDGARKLNGAIALATRFDAKEHRRKRSLSVASSKTSILGSMMLI